MKKINILIGLLMGLLLIQGIAFASADLKAMGNGAGPAATGDNGFDWNPAAISPDHVFVWDLIALDMDLYSDSLSAMDILEYGGFVEGSDNQWSRDDVNDILKSIPNSGFSLYMDTDLRTSMIIGPVGLSTDIKVHTRGTLDKDIFNVLLKGNKEYVDITGEQMAEKLVDLSDTQADVLATAGSSFTVSLPIKSWLKGRLDYFDDFYAGTSLHGVAGAYGNIAVAEETAFYISYSEPNEDGYQIPMIRFKDQQDIIQKLDAMEEGEMFPLAKGIFTMNIDDPMDLSYIGKGAAVDLGVYARKNNFRYGLSFMNMGAMNIANYQIMEFGVVKDSTLEEGFTLTDPVFKVANESLRVPLPFRVNLGASYQKDHWFLAGAHLSGIRSVSVNLDENDEIQYSGHGQFEYGAGIELNPLWIFPVRVGIVGSTQHISLTSGFGLHLGPLKTDLGVVTSYKHVSVSLNSSIEF